MTRQEANLEILKHLHDVVNEYPDWRFHQLLVNTDVMQSPVVDLFNEESTTTLHRVQKIVRQAQLRSRLEALRERWIKFYDHHVSNVQSGSSLLLQNIERHGDIELMLSQLDEGDIDQINHNTMNDFEALIELLERYGA